MHKVRKNSLSPCYSTMNKQNLPIENLTTPIGISFKTLEQARKKKTLDCKQSQPYLNPKQSLNQYHFKASDNSKQRQSHHHLHLQPQPQLYPQPHTPAHHHHLQSTITDTKRDHDRSVDDYRQSLKSKDKQMSSLHSQVSTLNTTIGLLKEQVSALKQENTQMSKNQAQIKKMLKDKNDIIQKLKKQSQVSVALTSYLPTSSPQNSLNNNNNSNNSMPIPQYLQISQKLNELQKIQDKLIEQNNQLRKKQQLHKAMLKNICTLANKSLSSNNNNKSMEQILQYVSIILNQ